MSLFISFQIKKCGTDKCAFGLCQQTCLPVDVENELSWLPDPVVDDDSPNHYKAYDTVKGTEITDDNRSSTLNKTVASRQDEQGCHNSMFTAQCVHMTVECTQCSKSWCLYSHVSLPSAELTLLREALQGVDYYCGSPLFSSDHEMHGKVFVKLFLRCADPVELSYYSSKLNFHGVCSYCATVDACRPQESLEKYFTVLPIGGNCKTDKPVICRMPTVGLKRTRVEKY